MGILERVYKGISRFAGDCVQTCISLVKISAYSRFRVKLPLATQDSCIVLGNGPSLSASLSRHPDFFKKHPLICVNGFALAKEYTELKPAYYILLDPVLWLDNNEVAKKMLDAIIQSTSWKLHLLVPQKAKNSATIQRIEQLNPNITRTYFNYTVFDGFSGIAHLLYTKNLAMPQSQNVLVATIFLGINMGFKNIFIVGADHTWHEQLHVNEHNQVCVKDVHFYENESKISYRLFYKDVLHQETFSMHEILHTFSKTFYGYHRIKKYADHRDAHIYNCSEISFIDAFERKPIH